MEKGEGEMTRRFSLFLFLFLVFDWIYNVRFWIYNVRYDTRKNVKIFSYSTFEEKLKKGISFLRIIVG